MARTEGSDNLFRLIHSLSSAEKRYFKKFASRHTSDGGKYLALFNAINRQPAFEEVSLKKSFKAYSAMKLYLFDMLVKSLIMNAEDLEAQEQIMLQMIGSRILQNRGLKNKVQSILEKALSAARREDAFFLEGELLWRIYAAKNQSFLPEELIKRLELFTGMEKARQKQANYHRYWEEDLKIWLVENINNYKKERAIRDPGIKVDLEFLQNRSGALTEKNERCRLYALSGYYNHQGDCDRAYPVAMELFKLVKKAITDKPPRAQFLNYINALASLLIICLNSHRIKEGLALADKEDKIKPRTENDRVYQFHNLVYVKTALYWRGGKHREGERFLHKHIALIMDQKYSERFAYNIRTILMLKIIFEFSNGHYHQAYLSVNDYQERYSRKSHARFFKDCELMKILIQVEMGHFELMNTLIQNVLRNRRLGLTDFDKDLLHILKNMRADNKKEVFRQLSERFPKDGREEGLFSHFGITEWIWSRHTGTPLSKAIEASLTREVLGV